MRNQNSKTYSPRTLMWTALIYPASALKFSKFTDNNLFLILFYLPAIAPREDFLPFDLLLFLLRSFFLGFRRCC